MYREQEERTISLWEEEERIPITLKNRKTGRQFSFVLKHRFVVGRNPGQCDLGIGEEDRYISGKHLRFSREGNEIYVEDLGTKNGTRLNGRWISSRTRILPGDILRMGRSEFELIQAPEGEGWR